MSHTILQSARGASAFTEPAPSFLASAGDTGLVFSSGADVPAHSWSQLIDQLRCLRTLENNWDGEGAESPHPSLVDGAITLAQTLQATRYPPADRVIASVNGTIYFEWHSPLGYREIEVTSPLDAEYREVEKGSGAVTVVGLSRRQ